MRSLLKSRSRRASSPTFRDQVARADTARDAGRFADAAEQYRAALALDPDQADIWVQLGNMLKDVASYDEAERAYREALRLRPDVSDTYLQLGHLMNLSGRLDEAVSYYELAVEADPDNGNAFQALVFKDPSSSVLHNANAGLFSIAERLDTEDLLNALRAKHADGFGLFRHPVFRPAQRRR